MLTTLIILLEVIYDGIISIVKGLIPKLLALYIALATIVFLFAIEAYQHQEGFMSRSFKEAIIWPYYVVNDPGEINTLEE